MSMSVCLCLYVYYIFSPKCYNLQCVCECVSICVLENSMHCQEQWCKEEQWCKGYLYKLIFNFFPYPQDTVHPRLPACQE